MKTSQATQTGCVKTAGSEYILLVGRWGQKGKLRPDHEYLVYWIEECGFQEGADEQF